MQMELGLSDWQANTVRSRTGEAKIEALAGYLRTAVFMGRYREDLSSRDGRLKELRDKWYVMSHH
jgi:hypothetical protein